MCGMARCFNVQLGLDCDYREKHGLDDLRPYGPCYCGQFLNSTTKSICTIQ